MNGGAARAPAPDPAAAAEARRTAAVGVVYGLAAYITWGFAPVFWKAVAGLPAGEVVAQRILWSVPLLVLFVVVRRRWRAIGRVFANRRTLLPLLASAVLMVANWAIFIVAVQLDRVLEISLGYFINPLVSVLLGVVFIAERLRRWQILAVVLAALGVVNLAISVGSLPWFGLGVAFTFGFYGLVRKLVATDPLAGLAVETAIFLPVALGYFGYVLFTGQGIGALAMDVWGIVLVLSTGLMTVIPLLWFIAGTRRLRYSTMGIIQYLAPSMHFVLALFYFGEPFTRAQAITFACIWAGLAIYSFDSMRAYRRGSLQTPGL
jgi:chloramphenicol-sensitive protein RarD